MSEDRVRITIEGGVADVRLVRSDKMNALDGAMFQAIVAAGLRLKDEKGLRAVVVSGEGRAFCAGLDMGNFGKMASGERKGGEGSAAGNLGERAHGESNQAQYVANVWRDVPVPVIAAVHGVAFGGGFQLMLGADMRYIAPDARLSVLEIKWGLVPDMAGVELMRRLVREDIVRELTYTGRIFLGEEAGRIGFATRVTASPYEDALATAREIAGKSPSAIRAAKRLMNLAQHGSSAEVLLAETVEQVALIGSPNQVEAIMSNMEKRAANYAD